MANKKQEGREYSPNWGGARAHKKKDENDMLSVQVAVRLTKAEKLLLEKMAAEENLTVSRFIHNKLFGN